jgi:hypothetical protein
MRLGYSPKLDATPELSADKANYYQSLSEFYNGQLN